ncbi:hypothetical protein BGW80DRAFT_1249660 [Lactifluus volemus]|nr:hypothetical protein BGW80DRAFT_1249660 [Lactifluus volemus]
MGKSIRSKTKRAFRAKKRTEGVFAAAEAARLQRLNTKLRCLTTATPTTPTGAVGEDVSKKGEQEDDNDDDTDMPVEDEGADADAETESPTTEGVADENAAQAQKFTGKISTHGPRGSRREQWRASKGMSPRPKSRGMNRQGTATARYKSGRSHRRR